MLIVPSLTTPISTDLPIVIIKKSDPLAGAALNITDDPLRAKPSLGWLVPLLGFCITPLILTSNCSANSGGWSMLNLYADPLKVALFPPVPLKLLKVFVWKLPTELASW